MFRVDLPDKARVLLEIHMSAERDLVHRHLPLNLVPVYADKVVGLLQKVLHNVEPMQAQTHGQTSVTIRIFEDWVHLNREKTAREGLNGI